MNILSIQSHVAYGYVGNRAATFPLQRLGFDVWAVNTVQFSNHTGYGAWKGEAFSPAHVRAVIDGIADRGVLGRCDALLSGYLGDPAMGEAVLEAAARLRAANPAAIWTCDPVMGDVGRGFFVRPGIPELFRDRIAPLADIVTPNQFELEHLAGGRVDTLKQAVEAARTVIARGTRHVLVTSLQRADAGAGRIEMLAVDAREAHLVATPLLDFPVAPNGSGDAVAALFLAHYLRSRDSAAALAEAAAGIFALMDATARLGQRELAMIAAQDELVRPSRRFPVVAVRENAA
ncbi:MAG: pyridoxal kinase PdxY [Reyranellaceae bacterium]